MKMTTYEETEEFILKKTRVYVSLGEHWHDAVKLALRDAAEIRKEEEKENG